MADAVVQERATGQTSNTILVDRRGSIAYLTLNRPDALNAINRELGNTLLGHLKDCEQDEDIRAIVITGAGRSFCAGDDIRRRPGDPPRPPQNPVLASRQGPYYNIVKAIRMMPKPVITKVRGFALGAGCELVLASDIAIAGESAKLGLVFVKRAIVGGTWLITKHVGLKKASEMLLTGEMIPAAQAADLGLITRCVPDSDLDQVVDDWADRLAVGPTRVIGYIKTGINHGLTTELERGLDYQTWMQAFATQTEDRAEGSKAFNEKRTPSFVGR